MRWPPARLSLTRSLLAMCLLGACGDTAETDSGAHSQPDATSGAGDAGTEDTSSGGEGEDATAAPEETTGGDEPDTAEGPPPARWPVGECADQPAGTGIEVGDIAMDFELMDQHGQMVRLHDFCDKTVLVVGSAFWCPGCIDKAPTLDAIYQAHKDAGFLIITLLTETLDNEPCLQEDLKAWADEYGQSFPVLSDVDGYIHTFTPKAGGKLPMEVLLGPGVEIVTVIDDITEQDIIDALP